MTIRDLFTRLHTRTGATLSEKSAGYVAKIASHNAAAAAHLAALKAHAAGEDAPDADEIEASFAAGDGGISPGGLGGETGTQNAPTPGPGQPSSQDGTGSRGMTTIQTEPDGFHPLATVRVQTMSFDANGNRVDPSQPAPIWFTDGRTVRPFPSPAERGEAR